MNSDPLVLLFQRGHGCDGGGLIFARLTAPRSPLVQTENWFNKRESFRKPGIQLQKKGGRLRNLHIDLSALATRDNH